MNVQRISVSLFSLVAVVTIALAGATIWLFLTNPVTVANAINDGDGGQICSFDRMLGTHPSAAAI